MDKHLVWFIPSWPVSVAHVATAFKLIERRNLKVSEVFAPSVSINGGGFFGGEITRIFNIPIIPLYGVTEVIRVVSDGCISSVEIRGPKAHKEIGGHQVPWSDNSPIIGK